MTAIAIAGLLCGANLMLWACLLAPLRFRAERERAMREARAYRLYRRGVISLDDYRRRAAVGHVGQARIEISTAAIQGFGPDGALTFDVPMQGQRPATFPGVLKGSGYG